MRSGWTWLPRWSPLPGHYRDIILLRDFEELSIKEIAASLKLTSAATKSRLHRARELAREYILAS